MTERSPARENLTKSLLLVGTLLATLLVLELTLQFSSDDPVRVLLVRADDFHPIYFKPDPIVGLIRRPNVNTHYRFRERPSGFIHFRTNNLGLRRVVPTQLLKPPGTKRVLILGDSQLDGAMDNEENLASVLEQKIADRGERCEVLNAATGSYSPYQSYLWYEHYGKKLQPDVVVLGVYIGNDLAELLSPGRPRLIPSGHTFREEGPTLEYLQRMNLAENRSLWTQLNSYLLQKSALYGHVASLFAVERPLAESPVAEAYETCLGCTAQSLGQIHWFVKRGGIEKSLECFAEITRRLKDSVEAEGGEILLLFLPSRLQIEPELDNARIQRVCEILALRSVDRRLEDELYRALLKLADRGNVPVIDLRPALLEAHRTLRRALYYQTDWHCNPLGHSIGAQKLFCRLESLGYLER